MEKVEFFKSLFAKAKKSYKEQCRQIMFTRTVIENLKEYLPEWETGSYAPYYICFKAPEEITLPEFMKVIDRFAKATRIEPKKHISEDEVEARFEFSTTHRAKGNWKFYRLLIEFTTKNTESCEVTYKRKMQKVPVLTGYCKEIAEQKHLQETA